MESAQKMFDHTPTGFYGHMYVHVLANNKEMDEPTVTKLR